MGTLRLSAQTTPLFPGIAVHASVGTYGRGETPGRVDSIHGCRRVRGCDRSNVAMGQAHAVDGLALSPYSLVVTLAVVLAVATLGLLMR
jgi:hypothetical protein